MKFFQVVFSVFCLATAVFAMFPAIRKPADGTIIQPGAAFDFDYLSIGDYGTSSYNLTVWIFTKPPQDIKSMEDWASGYFLGRFGYPSYPSNPAPPNVVPKQLIMPDFSKLGGGFGVGATASNATFYFTVIEEYLNGEPNIGFRFNLLSNTIRYNVTV